MDALYEAVEEKNWEVAKQLLREITSTNNKHGFDELLQFAAFMSETEIIKILLQGGADINYKNIDGMTALHFVLSPINTETIQKLPRKSEIDDVYLRSYEPRRDNYLTFRHFYYDYPKTQEPCHGLAECYYIAFTKFFVRKLPVVDSLNSGQVISNDGIVVVTSEGEPRETNVELIMLLLNFGADVNAFENNGKTPLHMAIECGSVKYVETLLKFKANVNISCCIGNIEGYTLLHLAARGTNSNIVELLINSGVDIDSCTSNGVTPLHIAVENELVENVKTLLQFKPDVNKTCVIENEKDFTPLHLAARKSNNEIFEMLLTSGAEVNATTENGQTPLHLAVKYGEVLHVKSILKYNPDVNLTCTLGGIEQEYTPLHLAAMQSNEEIVGMLLDSGAYINEKTNYGKTPFILAVENNHLNNTKLLLNYKAELDHFCTSEDEGGYTALHYAAKGTNEKILEILLNSVADVNIRTTDGKTPLHLAVESKCVNNVKNILLHKGDVNIFCNSGAYEGYTPLHFAAKQSCGEIIEILIQAGAHIDAITKNGKTALHLAVEFSFVDNVKILIKYKADVNRSSASGDAEDYTRFVFNSSDMGMVISEKLLKNRNDYFNLHLISKQLIDPETFDVVVKYKPVSNCKCTPKNAKAAIPIHFAVKGCTDEISVFLKLNNKRSSTTRELMKPFNQLKYGYMREKCEEVCAVKYVPDCSCSCINENYTPLHYASKGCNEEITELLLNSGANINARTSSGKSALYLAVEHGRVGNINLLLKYKADVNLACELGFNTGYTPLHCAAAIPDTGILETLLNNGADVNMSTSNGESTLFPAIKLGNIGSVRTLLQHKLDLNNENHRLAFAFAVTNADKNIISTLVDYGFKISYEDLSNIGVLKEAIFKNFKIWKSILKLGFDVNSLTESGDPILHVACKTKNFNLLKDLITHNVNLNCFDKYGNTALHIVTCNQSTEMMVLLLEHGTNVNIKNNHGYTALNKACENYDCKKPQTEKCIEILLQYNSDINTHSNNRTNPLCSLISKSNSYNLVEKFLKLGADVNITCVDGVTPINVAMRKCDNEDNQPEKYMMLLLKYGADINSSNSYKNTPLHIACNNYLSPSIIGHSIDNRIVTLLELGSDIMMKTYFNQTGVELYLHCYTDYRRRNRNIPKKFFNTTIYLLEHLVMEDLSETASLLIEQILRKNYLYSEEVKPLCSELRSHLSKCETEISEMKKEFIGNVSVYDLLTGNVELLTKLPMDFNISFALDDNFKGKYPLYSSRLINNLMKRKEQTN